MDDRSRVKINENSTRANSSRLFQFRFSNNLSRRIDHTGTTVNFSFHSPSIPEICPSGHLASCYIGLIMLATSVGEALLQFH